MNLESKIVMVLWLLYIPVNALGLYLTSINRFELILLMIAGIILTLIFFVISLVVYHIRKRLTKIIQKRKYQKKIKEKMKILDELNKLPLSLLDSVFKTNFGYNNQEVKK